MLQALYQGRDAYVSKAQKDSFVFISDVCLHQSHIPSVFSYLGIMTALQPAAEKVNSQRANWKDWFTSGSDWLEVQEAAKVQFYEGGKTQKSPHKLGQKICNGII